jgi:hypothetical protein
MLAVDHGDRAEEALPADVLFAQVAEADPCLADMPPLGVVNPKDVAWLRCCSA